MCPAMTFLAYIGSAAACPGDFMQDWTGFRLDLGRGALEGFWFGLGPWATEWSGGGELSICRTDHVENGLRGRRCTQLLSSLEELVLVCRGAGSRSMTMPTLMN